MRRIALPLLLLLCLLLLSASAPPYLHKEIDIYLDGERIESAPLRIDTGHSLRAERMGGYLKLYESLLTKYSTKEALNYLAVGLGDYLSAECERRRVDPLDATLEWSKNISSPFIYYDERPGREVDLLQTGRLIARAMDIDGRAEVRAYSHEVAPNVTAVALRAVTKEIARFSTSFASSGENRRHNIALAAQAIGGKVIAPNETFSFNDVVGRRTAERGFREAKIVVNGEFVKGIGGGVCQVSTTLYNAVLLASLQVENAAAHSIPVSYVPCSRDCTVSSSIDFCFRNDSAYPVYIATEIRGSSLTFVLYGERRGEPCRLESEIVERIPYSLRYEDGSVADPAAILLSPGREGIKSRLYRVSGGKKTLIRENFYSGKDAVYQKSA